MKFSVAFLFVVLQCSFTFTAARVGAQPGEHTEFNDALSNDIVLAGSSAVEVAEHRMLRQTTFFLGPPLLMVTIESTQSFDDTYNTLRDTLDANPVIRIVAEIDHAAAAASAGLELLPNRLIVFGNPNLGTPIMEVRQTAGLDLPQKILVWQDENGKVFVGYNPPDTYLKARFGKKIKTAPTISTMSMALKGLAAKAAGVEADIIDTSVNFVVRFECGGKYLLPSNAPFQETWDRLLAAIDASPAKIAFTVDHQLGAINTFGADGTTLRPTRLVVFGNPNLGTPLMKVSPTAGIDLPLKILVTENAMGDTLVTTNIIGYLRVRHGLEGIDQNLLTTQNAILNFMSIATTGAPRAA